MELLLRASFSIAALASITPTGVTAAGGGAGRATETAYFTVSWTIVSAILVAVLMVCGPFIAETAAHPGNSPPAGQVPATVRLGHRGRIGRARWQWRTNRAVAGQPELRRERVGADAVGRAGPDRERARCGVRLPVPRASDHAAGGCAAGGVHHRVIAGCAWVIPRHGIAGVGWTYAAVETAGSLLIAIPVALRLRIDLRDPSAADQGRDIPAAVDTVRANIASISTPTVQCGFIVRCADVSCRVAGRPGTGPGDGRPSYYFRPAASSSVPGRVRRPLCRNWWPESTVHSPGYPAPSAACATRSPSVRRCAGLGGGRYRCSC